MDKPAEILLFDFLAGELEAALPESPLFDLELHDTIFQSITRDRGLRISEAVGDFSPGPENEEKEYDVLVILVCFSRVKGQEDTLRQPALVDVFQIQKQIYSLLRLKSTLGDRVCDSLLKRGSRGYEMLNGEAYAVANVPLVINPSGARYNEE
jgi:hypothetical protein